MHSNSNEHENVGVQSPPRNAHQKRPNKPKKERIVRTNNQPNAINNKDTLNRILSLPLQNTDNPLIYQFYNGSHFS